jgi:hypothetical protein
MHFGFIPYGKRDEVELLLRDMEAQKHLLKMSKGDVIKEVYIQGQIRTLPLGVYEYVFPKEDLDYVLNSMMADENRYQLNFLVLKFLKKFYRYKKIPKYNKEKKFLWIKDNVNIVPIGIREDGVIEDNLLFKGFSHEAI